LTLPLQMLHATLKTGSREKNLPRWENHSTHLPAPDCTPFDCRDPSPLEPARSESPLARRRAKRPRGWTRRAPAFARGSAGASPSQLEGRFAPTQWIGRPPGGSADACPGAPRVQPPRAGDAPCDDSQASRASRGFGRRRIALTGVRRLASLGPSRNCGSPRSDAAGPRCGRNPRRAICRES